MDLQALRYFRIVAREGSFSQAAQKLNYAQSNLSTKIRQLEGELETPLFRRHAHGVTLTEKGESLLAYADRLVHLLEEAESVLRDDGTAKGSLSVGSMESAAITFIPVLLAEYHSRCPGVSLTVKTGVSQASMRSVLDGTLDGAFVAGATGHAELSSVPVRRERLALFSATGTETTPVANLLAGPLLVLPHGCSYRQSLEEWLDAERIFPERAVEFDSIGALLASVSAGLGAALFPESLASVYTAAKGLICHAVPEPYAWADISFVWRRDRFMDSTFRSFLGLLREKSKAGNKADISRTKKLR